MHKIFCLSIFWSFLFSHTADHLVFIKVITQPDDAEMIAIHNPTNYDIDLSDYYLTDAIDEGKVYYNLPENENFWRDSKRNFIARFPNKYVIARGDTITLGLHDVQTYHNYFGQYPDLALFEDMRNAVDNLNTIGEGPEGIDENMLTESKEVLILFKWESGNNLVEDVDYFLWGNTNSAISKSRDDGYPFNDTPIEDQHPIRTYTHSDIMDSAYVRIGLEETDEISPGNGITGHDETSENFSKNWIIELQREIIWGCTDKAAGNYNPLATVDDTTCTNSFKAVIDGNYNCSEESLDYCSSDRECPTIKIQGLVVDYFDITIYGGPHAVTLENQQGYRIELSIWPSEWDLENDDSLGYFIKAPFNRFIMQAEGSVFEYEGDKQVLICNPENAAVLSEINFSGSYVEAPVSKTAILPEPFVLLPSRGETLDYSYSFPDNSRVIIRILDLSGRFVTSLIDKNYQDSGTISMDGGSSAWDGRDHLGQIVPPGTYIMHIETMNFSSGETHTDAAPIVVGVKN